MRDQRGDAPSRTDIEFEELCVWWAEEYGFADPVAKRLALYQYTGGNCFALVNMFGEICYAERPTC